MLHIFNLYRTEDTGDYTITILSIYTYKIV